MNDQPSDEPSSERIPFLELEGSESKTDSAAETQSMDSPHSEQDPWIFPPEVPPNVPIPVARRFFRISDLPRSQLWILALSVLVLLLLLPRLVLILSVFMAEILILLRLALIPLSAFFVAVLLLRWISQGRASG